MAHAFPVYRIEAESPFERGVQHGLLAREQIAVTIGTYSQIFRDWVQIDWEEAKRIGESYREPIERYGPDLAEEIRGIAEGSGFAHAELLALNSRSEIALSARLVEGCTAFASFGRATRGETTVLAQNWDWRPALREAMAVLLVEQPGKPSLTMLTEAGIIGKLGFNSAGLGVCLNAIVTDRVDEGGTPLHVALRGILDSRNLGDAIWAASRANIACSANVLIAQHENGAVDIETVPGEMDVLLPERDVLAHTNHLVSPRLLSVRDLGRLAFPDTYVRLARVRRLLEERHGRLDRGTALEILCDHANLPDSICRHVDEIGDPEGRQVHSVLSLVMDLEQRTLEVTDGPPCSGEYVNPVEVAALAALQA